MTTPRQRIRVFVMARDREIRSNLENVIAAGAGMSLAGSAGTPDGARRMMAAMLPDVRPDLVLWAADTPADLRALSRSRPDGISDFAEGDGPAVLLLTAGPDIAAEDGSRVRGRLSPQAEPVAIRAAVEAVIAGLVVFDRAGFDSSAEIDPPVRSRPRLSVREVEVLRLVAEGLPNKTIAWRLEISEHTAKFHVASILAKLGVASRAQAVREGLRLGLILL